MTGAEIYDWFVGESPAAAKRKPARNAPTPRSRDRHAKRTGTPRPRARSPRR
jgi:hypothetical protein